MTIEDAQQAVVGQLVFGDKTQIAALDLIKRVDRLAWAIKNHEVEPVKCGTCNGTGEVHCRYFGQGVFSCEDYGGTGIAEFGYDNGDIECGPDVIREALAQQDLIRP